MPDPTRVPDVLPRLREQAGIRTQKELAERAGISRATVNNLESGKTRPDTDTLRQLARGLALDPFSGDVDETRATVILDTLMRAAGYIGDAAAKHEGGGAGVDDLEFADVLRERFGKDVGDALERLERRLGETEHLRAITIARVLTAFADELDRAHHARRDLRPVQPPAERARRNRA